jgi:hypothetical protein
MKPLEQQISDAVPRLQSPLFTIDAGTKVASDGFETLGPGLSTNRSCRGGLGRKFMHAVLAFTLLAAGGWGVAVARTAPSKQQEDNVGGGRPAGSAATGVGFPSASSIEWRTASLVTPWADASSTIEASIELPVVWSVHRLEPSAGYPGLNATVYDEYTLPVAMLYLGPSPDPPACRLSWEPELILQQTSVTTGAELLDPNLASGFSYGLTTEKETRGSFGLVQRTSGGNACGDSERVPGSPPLILRFGDVLRLDTRGHSATASRSSYARTFSSAEDGRHYLQSQEFATLKRLISSLRFSFPDDRSRLWQLPDHRRPSN